MATPIQNNTEALREILEAAKSLPTATEVKVATGTCTGDNVKGYVEVEMGFKPDIVIFQDFTYPDYTDPSKIYAQSVVMWFKELEGKGYADISVNGYWLGNTPVVFYPIQTETGFIIREMWAEYYKDSKYGWYVYPGKTMSYMAVKYTP